MRSKLAAFVIVVGFLTFAAYILYDYSYYGDDIFLHLVSPESTFEIVFHVLIFIVFIGSIITYFLINDRKKLLDRTLASEKKLNHALSGWKTTFDSIPYGVMLIDNEFNIVRVNSAMEHFFDIPLKERPWNKKCHDVIHKINIPVHCCPLKQAVETGKKETVEFYEREKDKHFMISAAPVIDDDGSVSAYVHSLIDITDMKKREEELTRTKNTVIDILNDLDYSYREIKDTSDNLIIAFANIIDAKSPWTKGHTERVTAYAIDIARELGLKQHDIKILRTASLLHDIGKVETCDKILEKQDKLTEEEFALVMRHPLKGQEILQPVKGLEAILPVIRSHHERHDGKGYPDGITGDAIPLLARILSVADAFDSMTSDRPYRRAPGVEYAISELKQCSGKQFDPHVVLCFLSMFFREMKYKSVLMQCLHYRSKFPFLPLSARPDK